MSEKEKMLSGKMYDATVKELFIERYKAKDLVFEINMTKPSEHEKRNKLFKQLLGSVGENFLIESPFQCDYGYNIHAGKNFYANHGCVILDAAKVSIGDNVFFAPNVGLYTAGHPVDTERRNKLIEYAYPITIGDNVWIGADVSVVPGVTIGDNVVIGAGSVVVKDIPSNVVAVGNPCKVLRKITEEDSLKDYSIA